MPTIITHFLPSMHSVIEVEVYLFSPRTIIELVIIDSGICCGPYRKIAKRMVERLTLLFVFQNPKRLYWKETSQSKRFM